MRASSRAYRRGHSGSYSTRTTGPVDGSEPSTRAARSSSSGVGPLGTGPMMAKAPTRPRPAPPARRPRASSRRRSRTLAPRRLVLGLPLVAGDRSHRGDQHRADDRVMLGPCAVRDVARAELAQLRDDRVEVAKRLAKQHERAEEHRLLPLHVVGEERAHGGRRREQARVELVHQLVAARRDEVEARLECLQVEAHLSGSFASGMSTASRRARRHAMGLPGRTPSVSRP